MEMTKSNKMCPKLRLRIGTKNNNTSSYMLLEHCFAFGLLLSLPVWKKIKEKFLKKGTPFTILPHHGRIWQKCWTYVRSHDFFIHTKFREHSSSGPAAKADFVFPYIYMYLCTPLLSPIK